MTAPEARDAVFVPVTRIDRVPVGHSVAIDVEGDRYALFHTEDGFFCITNRCPHQGAPLAGSPIVRGTRIRCALHGWIFELDPAKPGGQADELARPRVRVLDGDVLVEVLES